MARTRTMLNQQRAASTHQLCVIILQNRRSDPTGEALFAYTRTLGIPQFSSHPQHSIMLARNRTTTLGAILFVAVGLLPSACLGFSPHSLSPAGNCRSSMAGFLLNSKPILTTSLSAKKKGGDGGKGFGKSPVSEPASTAGAGGMNSNGTAGDATQSSPGFGLQSIDDSSTSEVRAPPPIDIDPNLPPEQRTKQILRQQYGLKSSAETEQDVAKLRREMELAGTLKKRKDGLEKYRQMSDDEFDIFQVIPAPLLKGIDTFLKGGLAVSGTLFIAAGIAICFEAYSKATETPLPEGWDDFITNTVEPNFTPGLGVLLGFSVSLGVFASAQLGSGSSVYSEDP